MGKILIFLLGFFYYFNTFAIVQNEYAKQHVDKTETKSSFILSFFSTETLINIALIILVVIVVLILIRFTNSKLTQYIEANSDGESREEMVSVVARVSNITFLTLGTAIVLGLLGIDIGIFMGGLGFGLGFTLKIFLSNFIGGIIMITQNSYHSGDLIKIGDKTGHIKQINSLFTVVEQFDGVTFFVPNVKFLEEEVYNFHANAKRRIEIKIGVDYETDLLKAKKVILQVLNNFENILKSPKPEVLITDFKDSSINISVRFWIESKGGYFVTKSNITETINLAFKQAGIVIPFPQVTLSNRSDFKINVKSL